MTLLTWLILAVAGGYQFIATLAALSHRMRRVPRPSERPPFSILKPVRGLEHGLEAALRSHFELDYPCFEILFGLAGPEDPARPLLERLCAAYPQVSSRVLIGPADAPNRKVGVLEELAGVARYPLLVVNDDDVTVPPGYLDELAALLTDPGVGLATCLYRAAADSFPGRWEALGIATDFAPSVLVARWVSVSEFALGSTLALRAADLERIGGFASLRDYLADDYQLGRRIASLGRRIELARTVIETRLSGRTWGEIWRHQLRWARTIRVSRPGGYLGLPVTQATLWSVVLAAAGRFDLAAALLALRMLSAFASGVLVLASPIAARWLWLAPLRDLWGVAVWLAGLRGNRVVWRERTLELDPQGRIRAASQGSTPE